MQIYNLIQKLPLNSSKKLKLYAFIKRVGWLLKYDRKTYRLFVDNQVLTYSNHYYGHEYWLKKYSGYNDYIYGVIEHGVYFGDIRNFVCPKEEWDLGSVITYGDSRINLLKEIHPDMNIVAIGPRIHYAETDKMYYNELYNQIDHSGKVLTLFPAHSLAAEKSMYDSELFLKQADEIAEKIGAKTIMVSLHPSDLLHHLDIRFNGKKVIFVGGGNDTFKFLPRLRAILELSDLTFSNALGTHVGYSIYMGTPLVMNLASNNNISKNPIFEEEQKRFASAFNGEYPLLITDEQKQLCDYYFGFSHIKTPEELANVLRECKNKYESIYYQ